jgi:hypothetical protein
MVAFASNAEPLFKQRTGGGDIKLLGSASASARVLAPRSVRVSLMRNNAKRIATDVYRGQQ